jgi:hypothetical protein
MGQGTRGLAGLCLAALMLGTTAARAQLTELYVPQNGTPGSQGWLPLVQGTPGSTQLGPDTFQLNTLADEATQHGFFRFSPVALDTAAGFMLTFNLRIDGSSTSSINRGGFSLVLVGKDPTRSLELAFSANEVFAYDYVAGDPDRFVRGASAGLMANVPYSYVLTVANDAFNLNINGQNLLSGGLVDYTGQGLPYTTPNFVFFGDDTSRASANAYLGPLVLTSTVPEPARAWLWLPGLLLLAGWLGARRRRQ